MRSSVQIFHLRTPEEELVLSSPRGRRAISGGGINPDAEGCFEKDVGASPQDHGPWGQSRLGGACWPLSGRGHAVGAGALLPTLAPSLTDHVTLGKSPSPLRASVCSGEQVAEAQRATLSCPSECE